MSKNEIKEILAYKGVECRSDWEFDLVVDAMVALYNRGVSDAVDKVLEATILGTEVRYNDLKIKI